MPEQPHYNNPKTYANKRSKFKTLEQVARVLLNHGIPFKYSAKCIEILDSDAASMAFDTATYDAETKEVVLMMGAFNNYFEPRHIDAYNWIISEK